MSIEIGRPIEEVFAVLADLENDVKWRREWVEARNTSDGALGVGTTTHLVGEGLGRRTEADYEITDYEPDRLVAWKTLSGPLPLTFRRAFERIEGGTRVTIGYDAEPRGFFLRLMRPVLVSMGKRQLEGDFPNLKELIETRTL